MILISFHEVIGISDSEDEIKQLEKRKPENDFLVFGKWVPSSKYDNYMVLKIKIPEQYDDFRKIIPTSGTIIIESQSKGQEISLKNKLHMKFEYSVKGIKVPPRDEDCIIVRQHQSVPKEFDELPQTDWFVFGKLNKDKIIIQYCVKKIDKKQYHEDIYATTERGEIWCYAISQIAIYMTNDLFK